MRLSALWLVIALLTAAAVAQQPTDEAPDAIFVNGKIVTVDTAFSIHQAFAVKGETFSAVGTNARIRALARGTTRVVDLRGATVVPGLTDNHNHVFDSAKVMLRGVSLEGASAPADALARIRQAVATAKPGETVFTSVLRPVAQGHANEGATATPGTPSGVPATNLGPGEPVPTKADLDGISTTVPILLVRGRRGNALFNRAALTRAGITRESPTYAGQALPRDANGEFTGANPPYPAGMMLVDSLLPAMTEAEEEAILLRAIQGRHARG